MSIVANESARIPRNENIRTSNNALNSASPAESVLQKEMLNKYRLNKSKSASILRTSNNASGENRAGASCAFSRALQQLQLFSCGHSLAFRNIRACEFH